MLPRKNPEFHVIREFSPALFDVYDEVYPEWDTGCMFPHVLNAVGCYRGRLKLYSFVPLSGSNTPNKLACIVAKLFNRNAGMIYYTQSTDFPRLWPCIMGVMISPDFRDEGFAKQLSCLLFRYLTPEQIELASKGPGFVPYTLFKKYRDDPDICKILDESRIVE